MKNSRTASGPYAPTRAAGSNVLPRDLPIFKPSFVRNPWPNTWQQQQQRRQRWQETGQWQQRQRQWQWQWRRQQARASHKDHNQKTAAFCAPCKRQRQGNAYACSPLQDSAHTPTNNSCLLCLRCPRRSQNAHNQLQPYTQPTPSACPASSALTCFGSGRPADISMPGQ